MLRFTSKRGLRRERDAFRGAAEEAFTIAIDARAGLAEVQNKLVILEADVTAEVAWYAEAWNQLVELNEKTRIERDGFEARYLEDDKTIAMLRAENKRFARVNADLTPLRDLEYKLLAISLLHEPSETNRCRRCNSKAPCKTMQIVAAL